MTEQKKIEDYLKTKAPQIEAMFTSNNMPVKVSQETPGTLTIIKDGLPMNLSKNQIEAVQMTLNLYTIISPDDIQDKTQKADGDTGPG